MKTDKQNLFLSEEIIGNMQRKQFCEDMKKRQHSFGGIVKIYPQTGKTVFEYCDDNDLVSITFT